MEKIEYSSNNSGGSWWLTDEDWYALERAGWEVDWYRNQTEGLAASMSRDGRFLGALASSATREGLTREQAIDEWEAITGQNADDEGCPCCGSPHSFW